MKLTFLTLLAGIGCGLAVQESASVSLGEGAVLRIKKKLEGRQSALSLSSEGGEQEGLGTTDNINAAGKTCVTGCDIGTALALTGGGFRAATGEAAVLAGLMAVGNISELGALLPGVATIASNSGGSWLAPQLIFSQNVNDLMTVMARTPSRAGKAFQDDWLTPYTSNGLHANAGAEISSGWLSSILYVAAARTGCSARRGLR